MNEVKYGAKYNLVKTKKGYEIFEDDKLKYKLYDIADLIKLTDLLNDNHETIRLTDKGLHFGDYIDLVRANEIINEQRKDIKELNNEIKNLNELIRVLQTEYFLYETSIAMKDD